MKTRVIVIDRASDNLTVMCNTVLPKCDSVELKDDVLTIGGYAGSVCIGDSDTIKYNMFEVQALYRCIQAALSSGQPYHVAVIMCDVDKNAACLGGPENVEPSRAVDYSCLSGATARKYMNRLHEPAVSKVKTQPTELNQMVDRVMAKIEDISRANTDRIVASLQNEQEYLKTLGMCMTETLHVFEQQAREALDARRRGDEIRLTPANKRPLPPPPMGK